jgi:hypothetical protein
MISRWILLRMRNVSDKSCRENQNTHFMFINVLLKTVSDTPQITTALPISEPVRAHPASCSEIPRLGSMEVWKTCLRSRGSFLNLHLPLYCNFMSFCLMWTVTPHCKGISSSELTFQTRRRLVVPEACRSVTMLTYSFLMLGALTSNVLTEQIEA